MNHCHKRAIFLYREGKVRTFYCPVCEVFIKISDTGKRWEERNTKEGWDRMIRWFEGVAEGTT